MGRSTQPEPSDEWCCVCAEKGRQSRLQLFQINETEAVRLCSESQCTYPLGARGLSDVVVQRNSSDVSNQRRKKVKNRRRTSIGISKTPTPKVLQENVSSPGHSAETKLSWSCDSNANRGPFQYQASPGTANTPIGTPIGLSANVQPPAKQFGSVVSAFTPYNNFQKDSNTTNMPNLNTCNYNTLSQPVRPMPFNPTASKNAVEATTNTAVQTSAADDNDDEDLGELLKNLPDFDNKELDMKLSDLFSELDSSQPCATSTVDFQSDSGIFDLSTPNDFDMSLVNADPGPELSLSVHVASSPNHQSAIPTDSVVSPSLNASTTTAASCDFDIQKSLKNSTSTCDSTDNSGPRYLQWKNVDALCWLDVCLCLLVHSVGISRLLQTVSLSQACILTTVIQAYKKAQNLFHAANSIQELSIDDMGRALKLETSIGRVSVRTGGGEIVDLLSPVRVVTPSESETTKSPQILNANVNTEASQEVLKYLREASEVLRDVRENVWAYLYPKLKCERGQNDSPVFALPLLFSNHSEIESKLMVKYQWKMSCDICGHRHEDRVQKVLPTFPKVPPDFSMEDPCFRRSCFKCQAPNQKMNMILDHGLPKVLTVHFVEGLWRVNPTDYDFSHRGSHYAVSGVVQYKENPSHFVAWIRNVEKNCWMECNDLKSPVCQYADVAPSFPPSQVHVVMWERRDLLPILETMDVVDSPVAKPATIFKTAIPTEGFQLPIPIRDELPNPIQRGVDAGSYAELQRRNKSRDMLLTSAKPPTQLSSANVMCNTPGSNVTSVAHAVAPVTTTTWSSNSCSAMQRKMKSGHLMAPSSVITPNAPIVMATGQMASTKTPIKTIVTPQGKRDKFATRTSTSVPVAAVMASRVLPPVAIGNLLSVQSAGGSTETSADRLARMRARFQNQKMGQNATNTTSPLAQCSSAARKPTKAFSRKGAKKAVSPLVSKVTTPIMQQSGAELQDYVRSRYNSQEAGKQVFAGYLASRSGTPTSSKQSAPSSKQRNLGSRKRKAGASPSDSTQPKNRRSTGARPPNWNVFHDPELETQTKPLGAGMLKESLQALPQFRGTVADTQLWPPGFDLRDHGTDHSQSVVHGTRAHVSGIKPLPSVSTTAAASHSEPRQHGITVHDGPSLESVSGFSVHPPPVSRVLTGGDPTSVFQSVEELVEPAARETSQDQETEVPVLRLELNTGSGRKTITLKQSGVGNEEVSEARLHSILQQICSTLSAQGGGSSWPES